MKDIYINGLGNISPQNTLDNKEFLNEITENQKDYLECIEPDYKKFISAGEARRMGRIIKMGVAAAKTCLDNAKLKMPDAIITGTGMGCMEDTEKFLTKAIEYKESFLTPTSFIQSTHNTISGQIALLLKCHAYNFAYVHRNFSFENGLLDSIMLINENEASNVLLGGIDEVTETYYNITKRIGKWKSGDIKNINLLSDNSKGTIAGEGSSFFVLGNEKTDFTYSKLTDMATFRNINNEIDSEIDSFLDKNNISVNDIDIIVLGLNGNTETDKLYKRLADTMFKETTQAYYKHLCGEYYTASAFALWLSAKIIKNQNIPEKVLCNDKMPNEIKRILIYNYYNKDNHSLILTEKC